MLVNGTSTHIGNLVNGVIYTISVGAVRGSKVSSPIAIQSAPAARFTTEADGITRLRMYEAASDFHSALTLDPSKGGPKSVSTARSYPDPSEVQLAIYINDEADTFDIGSAFAFFEFANAHNFDRDVRIGRTTYLAYDLNTWFYSGDIEPEIDSQFGNVKIFRLPYALFDYYGHGFFIRTGTPGNYHYARVFVVNNGGRFLQGTAPDRYVEVEISYQTAADVPYAKTSGRGLSPAGVASRRRR